MSSKKHVYNWVSFSLSVGFVVLCLVILIASLIIQNILVTSINNVYSPITSSYNDSQTAVKTTITAMSGYKQEAAKLIGSTDFLAQVGADNKLKEDVIATIDDLQTRVTAAQTQTTNLLEIVDNLNALISYVNEGASTDLPKITSDDIKGLSSGLDNASASLAEIKAMVNTADPNLVNAALIEGLTNTVNSSLDSANTIIVEVNNVVKDQFKQLTNLKNSILWWIRFSTAMIIILFVWAIYTGAELAREKYTKLRHNKSEK